MKISDLNDGNRARIKNLSGAAPAYRAKLLQLGLRKGSEFTILRRAPLGDPIEISLDGALISLRRHEAMNIEIEKIA